MKKVINIGVFIHYEDGHGRKIFNGLTKYLVKGAACEWEIKIIGKSVSEYIGSLRGFDLDGIICSIYRQEELDALYRLNIPVVNVSSHFQECRFPSVTVDNNAIGELAATHLLERNLNSFLYIYEKELGYGIERYKSFEKIISDSGAEATKFRYLSEKAEIELGGRSAAPSVLLPVLKALKKPAGIFTTRDFLGYLTVLACKHQNLNIPEDICVVSVDNDDIFSRLSRPPLSSIDLGTERIGYQAASVLEDMILGKQTLHTKEKVPPLELITRDSTNILPFKCPNLIAAIKFIKTNLEFNICVNDIVAQVPISRRSLEMLFRKNLHITINDFIQSEKLNRATSLLKTTNLTIDDIAERSGFQTVSYFYRAFKKVENLTPAQFRKNIGNVIA